MPAKMLASLLAWSLILVATFAFQGGKCELKVNAFDKCINFGGNKGWSPSRSLDVMAVNDDWKRPAGFTPSSWGNITIVEPRNIRLGMEHELVAVHNNQLGRDMVNFTYGKCQWTSGTLQYSKCGSCKMGIGIPLAYWYCNQPWADGRHTENIDQRHNITCQFDC